MDIAITPHVAMQGFVLLEAVVGCGLRLFERR